MRSPLNKAHRITSPYGNRILAGNADFHNGLDMTPQDGKHPTELFAVADGTIVDMRNTVPDSHTGLRVTTMVTGNYINIRTRSGHTIIYRHLRFNSIPSTLRVGQEIREGTFVGIMGTTGHSTGIHLHYEIRDSN